MPSSFASRSAADNRESATPGLTAKVSGHFRLTGEPVAFTGFRRCAAAAMRALELDDTLVEALTCLAFIHETYEWDFPSAERAYQRAIALSPNYAFAHQRYAMHLERTGRQEAALDEAQLARDLDPLSVDANVSLGLRLLTAGRPEAALQQTLAAVELDRNYFDAYVLLGEAYERLGRGADAIAAAQRGVDLSQRGAHALQALAYVPARIGQKGHAKPLIEELERHPTQRNAYDIAMLHLTLDQTDRALFWLEQACKDRTPAMAFLKVAQAAPKFDAVRERPRFREILRCVEAPI